MPDSNPHTLDRAQIQLIMDGAADAAIVRFASKHPELAKEPAIHPLVKWVVGAIAALGLAAMIGGGTWLVSSVSQMQITLARVDERMTSGTVKDSRVDDLTRRVTNLERYHEGGNK